MRIPRWPGWLLAAVLVALVTGCGSSVDQAAQPTRSSTPGSSATASVPANPAEVYLPPAGTAAAGRPVPVVLVIPGGGWYTAERSGMTALATDLAAAGFFVVNSTYRVGIDGYRFPIPLQDVRCAAGYAVAQAKASGMAPGPFIAVGHSAGGHLVALAAVSGTTLAAPCPDPVPRIDGVVGLAGVYDTASPFASLMQDFFGVPRSEDPALWRSGDPIAYVEDGVAPRELSVLLLHGDADDNVPVEQSRAFAEALTKAGMAVHLDVVPGATHDTIYRPEVAAKPVIDWIRSLAAIAASPTP